MVETEATDELTKVAPAMAKAAARQQKLNHRFLEDGEEVRAAVIGNAGRRWPSHLLLLGTWLRIARKSKDLIFLATDRNVYVLRGYFWRLTRGKELLEKHRRGEVIVTAKGLVVQVGEHSLVQIDYLRGTQQGAQFAALASKPAA